MSDPSIAEALAALKAQDYGRAKKLVAAYGHSHAMEPRHYLIQGLSEIALLDWPSAALTFVEASEKYPTEARLWFNRGMAEESLGDLKKAVTSYERALAIEPRHADTCGNLSNVYCNLARFAEAEKMARMAMEFGAPQAQALNSLGLALQRQYKFTEAQSAFEQSAQMEPHNSFVWSNLANLFVDQLKFDEAWPCFARARVAANDAPIIRHHEGMARLLAGDFIGGWELCEARLAKPGALRVTPHCARYDGKDLKSKKLIIVAEQGFGDMIQFCRYGSLLTQMGVEIIWVVPRILQRLLQDNMPGIVVTEKDTLPAADYYLPVLSLPYVLNKFLPQDAPPAPYLRAPQNPALLASNGKRKIGLVWSGSPTHERDYERSIPLAKLAPLIEKIPAQYFAMFTGAGLEQIGDLPVTRLDQLMNDFADTTALLKQLDCLVTVDTSVAHLAGAIGVPTFLLLPYCPDWRWGAAGNKTAWYPSLTLLRQTKPGDWDGVITQLADDLARKLT